MYLFPRYRLGFVLPICRRCEKVRERWRRYVYVSDEGVREGVDG